MPRRRLRPAPKWAPEPPVPLPPGSVIEVPGRGELFVRDSGGDGPVVLLLHGWTASADLNWVRQYAPLAEAGYRVLALDHRGHGRGLRTYVPFSLADCADDAAALVRHLGVAEAVACGYSMGGPVAQLAAHRHPDLVRGLVCCATSASWDGPRDKALWNGMALFRLALALAPYEFWRRGLRLAGLPDSAETTWVAAELTRGSSRDIAEAGRELGRFDSRPWLAGLGLPAAVVLTTRDDAVPPQRQRDLAERLRAPVFEVEADHFASGSRAPAFNRALLAALERVARAGVERPAAATAA